jgi:integrase/recombinase XerC
VAEEAVRLLLSDTRSEETRRAYANDLRFFFRWRGHDEPTREAVEDLCSEDAGTLALTLNGYKAAMRDRNLSEATINRRLAAVRSLLRMARRLGAECPDPAGLVDGEKVTPYRDTRGPALSEARRLLAAPDRSTVKGKRDFALLLLFSANALRRGELHRSDVGDFEPENRRLFILGKGKGSQKEPVTLSTATAAALADYLNARGRPDPAAPLFCNVARFTKAETRLSGRGLLHIVNDYGKRVLGKSLHPHALRHMAITAALDNGWELRKVQRLSRHKDIRTLQLYDDNREDMQGQITEALSKLLHQEAA